MLAVPPAILDVLKLKVGGVVGLTVDEEGRLVVEPKPQPRYSLAELLVEQEAATEIMQNDELVEWTNSQPAGRELI